MSYPRRSHDSSHLPRRSSTYDDSNVGRDVRITYNGRPIEPINSRSSTFPLPPRTHRDATFVRPYNPNSTRSRIPSSRTSAPNVVDTRFYYGPPSRESGSQSLPRPRAPPPRSEHRDQTHRDQTHREPPREGRKSERVQVLEQRSNYHPQPIAPHIPEYAPGSRSGKSRRKEDDDIRIPKPSSSPVRNISSKTDRYDRPKGGSRQREREQYRRRTGSEDDVEQERRQTTSPENIKEEDKAPYNAREGPSEKAIKKQFMKNMQFAIDLAKIYEWQPLKTWEAQLETLRGISTRNGTFESETRTIRTSFLKGFLDELYYEKRNPTRNRNEEEEKDFETLARMANEELSGLDDSVADEFTTKFKKLGIST